MSFCDVIVVILIIVAVIIINDVIIIVVVVAIIINVIAMIAVIIDSYLFIYLASFLPSLISSSSSYVDVGRITWKYNLIGAFKFKFHGHDSKNNILPW